MRIPSSSHRYISLQVERSHGEGCGVWYRLVIDTTDGVCAVAPPIGGLLPRQRGHPHAPVACIQIGSYSQRREPGVQCRRKRARPREFVAPPSRRQAAV